MSTAAALRRAIEDGNEPLRIVMLKLIEKLDESIKKDSPPPLWTEDECDTQCEWTGTPIPSAYAVEHEIEGEMWTLHPSVLDYWKAHPDITPGDELPERVTAIPAKTRKAESRLPKWTLADLPALNRPQLYQAAKEIGLSKVCKKAGIDYRFESNAWICDAIKACKNNPVNLPKPANEKNLVSWVEKPIPRKPDAPTPEEGIPTKVLGKKKKKGFTKDFKGPGKDSFEVQKKKKKKKKPKQLELHDKPKPRASKPADLTKLQWAELKTYSKGHNIRKRDKTALHQKGYLTKTHKLTKAAKRALGLIA